jgi:Fe(3+) dicitrate transport protein
VQNGYDAPVFHRLELKAGFANEGSDETYAGLSEADFRATPYRRYAGTRLDRMDWDHLQLGLAYDVRAGALRVRLAAYRNTLDRAWRKLAALGDRSVEDVLAAPASGNNAVFYSILTGQSDSTGADDALVIGTNDRRFVAQGAQATTTLDWDLLEAAQESEVGLRMHFDRARRLHSQDRYLMQAGTPTRLEGTPREVTLDATGSAYALSGYAQHRVTAGPLQLQAALRAEQIWNRWIDRGAPGLSHDESYSILLPGGGVVYQPRPWLGLLGGVHRGFVPVSAGPGSNVRPEESVNYESGVRLTGDARSFEVIVFLSDYANLKGTCTQSTGCRAEDLDREFDGGAVLVVGAEVMGHADLKWGGGLHSPLHLAYTFTRSEFRSGFRSENPQWGDVRAGDEIPYVPAHQLALQAGLAGASWDVAVYGFVTSALRERPGQGAPAPGTETDANVTLDVSASYNFGRWGTVYSTATNVTGRDALVSRLPYGARPGAPRLLTVGYRNHF